MNVETLSTIEEVVTEKFDGFFKRESQVNDIEIERVLERLSGFASSESDLVINLISVKWVDLYALIRILFIIRSKSQDEVGCKGRSIIRIIDPRKVPNKARVSYEKVLSFLTHLDFFSKASEVGCIFHWVTEWSQSLIARREIPLASLESAIKTQLPKKIGIFHSLYLFKLSTVQTWMP